VKSERGAYRVIRGGSFDGPAAYLRAAYRTYYGPGSRYSDLGLRPVLDESCSDRLTQRPGSSILFPEANG